MMGGIGMGVWADGGLGGWGSSLRRGCILHPPLTELPATCARDFEVEVADLGVCK